jgi:hypothetical protein
VLEGKDVCAAGQQRLNPQQFYIGDDEAWRTDDPADTLPLVTGGAWRSEPGLPNQKTGKPALAAVPSTGSRSKYAKSLQLRAVPEEEEDNPAERARLVADLRKQLQGLSTHSRHLLTVPLVTQATDRTTSSTGGTFREYLPICNSEDMLLLPPSCLEAEKRPPEMQQAVGGANIGNGQHISGGGAQDNDADDITAALKQMPPPMPMPPAHVTIEDDEECDCERYAVSRQRDGRLVWAPEQYCAG